MIVHRDGRQMLQARRADFKPRRKVKPPLAFYALRGRFIRIREATLQKRVFRNQHATIKRPIVLWGMVKFMQFAETAATAVGRGSGELVMPGKRGWFLAVVFAASAVLAQTAPAPAGTTPGQVNAPPATPGTAPKPKPHRQLHKVQTPAPVVLPPMPDGPLSQMPMDQIPPTPAKVTFQGGLLTISAQNSTLGEILRDVHKLTGASIEFPLGSGGSNEHVVTHLCPAAPRDVLVGLLNGSSFNYVMVGSNVDPTAVSSVILTPKEQPAGQTQTAANVYQGGAPPMPPNRAGGPRAFNPAQSAVPMAGNGTPAPAEGDDSAAADEPEAADDNADDQAQPGQPEATDANAQAQQPADPNQPNAGPKTPEQILEMLRRPQQQPGGVVNNPPQPPQQ